MAPPVAGYVTWFDASDATSITLNGNNVSQWNDKGSQAANLTQGTAGNQPDYTHTINGLNVVTFNGTTSFMSSAPSNVAQPFTVFAAYQLTDTTKPRVMDNATGGRWLYNASSGKTGIYAGTVLDGSTNTLNVLSHTGLFNGASSISRVNGATDVSGNAGTGAWSSSGFRLATDGLSTFGAVRICEIIIYASDQTANFATTESYLNTRWLVAAGFDVPLLQPPSPIAANPVYRM